MAILADLKDPRVRNVTVTFVEVSPDMRQAKVHVSIMGDETQQRLSLRGLQNSAGYLQSKLADRIETRYTPRLEFVLDQGVKQSIEIAKILNRVLPPTGDESAEIDEETDEEIDEEFDDEFEAELGEDETVDAPDKSAQRNDVENNEVENNDVEKNGAEHTDEK